MENLFLSMEYYAGQDLTQASENDWQQFALPQLRRQQKPIAKVWGVAKAIQDIDADILMLVEVGGEHSLVNFNRYFLDDAYTPYFIAGNSRRSIDLGFLVKKGLPFRVEPVSNKETPIEVQTYLGKYFSRFSRDVAELRLHDDQGMRMILLLTHLKSKISSDQDLRGNDVRTAEAIALAQIYQKLREQFPEVPIVLGGDFNADLTSPEFDRLSETDIAEMHRLLGTPVEERHTLVYFDHSGTPHAETLDYLLVSPHLIDCIVPEKSYTYRYKGFYDLPNELPRNRKERYLMVSDHHPVVMTLDLSALGTPD